MDDRNRNDRNRHSHGQRGAYRDQSQSYGGRQAEPYDDDSFSRDFGYGSGGRHDEGGGQDSWRSYSGSQSPMSDQGRSGRSGSSQGASASGGYGAQHDRFAQGDHGDSSRSFGSPQYQQGPGSYGVYSGDQGDRSRGNGPYRAQGDSNYGASYGRADNRSARSRAGGWDDSNRDRGFFERASDEVASWFGDEDATRRRQQDHRGNGPANYSRSDERVLEDACDCLTEDWSLDARNIQVTVLEGEVTLDGTVDSRQAKRRAEDLVDDLSGVKHVQNNLRVQAGSNASVGSNESTRMSGMADSSRMGTTESEN